MTARTGAVHARRARTQLLDVLTTRLDTIAAGRPEPLTPTEASRLAETIRAHRADAEQTERHRLGLARARSAGIDQLKAAEIAIREAEQDRDNALSALTPRAPQAIRKEHTLTDQQMTEITKVVNQRARSNVQIIGTHPA